MQTFGRRWIVSVRSWTLAMVCLLMACGAAAAGPLPMVRFDVAQTASCRTASSPECVKQRSHAHVVEVVFDISTRMAAGKEADLKSITYEITSPGRQLSLVGYLPTTIVASDVADGVINFEEHHGTGQLSLEYAGAGTQAKIQAPLNDPVDTKVAIKKLAPKSLLMASGTIDRAHGVFFTLHPSSQDSIQRTHQFVCYFEVSDNFRADYVQIVCSAVAQDRAHGGSSDAERPAGSARFTVGIFLDGDREAQHAAEVFADRQQDLFDAVVASRAVKVDRSNNSSFSPTVVFQTVLHMGHKDIPPTATTAGNKQNRTGAKGKSSVDGLPAEVIQAQRAVEVAKQTLRGMNGVKLE